MESDALFEVLEIETLTTCNLRCSYCPNSVHERGLAKNRKVLKTELFKKLVDELAELEFAGDLRPHFYGEPLLDDRLPTLMGYARGQLPNASLTIFSNGTLLTLPLYKTLVDNGVNRFIITQHTPTMPMQLEEVQEYNRLHHPSVQILRKRFRDGDSLMNRGGLFQLTRVTHPQKTCQMPTQQLTIDYQGNVVLCCNDYSSSMRFGNIETQPLLEIWNSSAFKAIRSQTLRDANAIPICNACAFGELALEAHPKAEHGESPSE